MQPDAALLPRVETYVPAGHAMQSDDSSLPTDATYRPTPHAMQDVAAVWLW